LAKKFLVQYSRVYSVDSGEDEIEMWEVDAKQSSSANAGVEQINAAKRVFGARLSFIYAGENPASIPELL
jgi:hypothetical protein